MWFSVHNVYDKAFFLCTQVDCVGSDALSSPVQLPCVWVHTAEWVNKTVSNTNVKLIHKCQQFVSYNFDSKMKT